MTEIGTIKPELKYPGYCEHCDSLVWGCKGCLQQNKDDIPTHYWELDKGGRTNEF